MNIKDFHDSLKYLFKAQVTPFIWGHAGIGKSSIIKQYAQENGYHFFPMYLGTQSDLGDVLGLADFVRDANGTAIATTFATPIWLKNCIDYCNENPNSGAIIFLDEFNRARKDVLQGMFSLALDKTFHTITLPKNCHVIAAGNPPTDEYQTTDVDDTALMARFAHVKLEPSVEEWVAFAQERKYNADIVSFIQEQPKLLEDARSNFNLPVKVDRRSYDRLQKLFDVNTPTYLLSQLMYGIIGVERVVAFEKFLQSDAKPLKAEQILLGEGKERLTKWSESTDLKMSLITYSLENMTKYLVSTQENLTNTQKENLFECLLVIPKETLYVFVRNNFDKDCKVFMEFAMTNKYKVTLIKLIDEAKGNRAKGKK